MSLKKYTYYNFIGSVAPMLVSIMVVPLYLHRIGEDRFGVLTIVWVLLGYFGVFDFGLSRATANLFAKLGKATATAREEMFWTALALNLLFGLAGGFVLYLSGNFILEHWFKIPVSLRSELKPATAWLACAIPMMVITGVFAGALEGSQRFFAVNLIQVCGNISFQIVPLAVAYLSSTSLSLIVPAAIISRMISTILPMVAVLIWTVPLRGHVVFVPRNAKQLLSYGGWASINGFIGPLLEPLDRVIIAATSGVAQVAAYTVPFNLVHRFQIVPLALVRALFPKFSELPAAEGAILARDAVQVLTAVMAPLFVVSIFALHPFMVIWVGADFARKAHTVGEFIILGVLANSLALIPFSLMQGNGRVREVAMIHLLLAPFQAAVIWCGATYAGIQGAAAARGLCYIIDCTLFLWRSKLLGQVWGRVLVAGAWVLSSALISNFLRGSGITGLIIEALVTACVITWSWKIEARFRQNISDLIAFIQRNLSRIAHNIRQFGKI